MRTAHPRAVAVVILVSVTTAFAQTPQATPTAPSAKPANPKVQAPITKTPPKRPAKKSPAKKPAAPRDLKKLEKLIPKAAEERAPVQSVPKVMTKKEIREAIKKAEAEKDDPTAKEPLPPVPSPEEGMLTRILRLNVAWSEKLDAVAEGIDVYLIGRKVTARKNETQIRLENSTYLDEGQGPLNTTTFVADVRLPNVEDYWNLKFSSYDEQADRRGIKRGNSRQKSRPQNYGASVGLTQAIGPVKTLFQPRVELKNPLRVAHSLIFETVADFKTWQANPKLEFFANPESGTGVFGQLNFNFIFTPVYSVLWVNDGNYVESDNMLRTNNGLSLLQIVNDSSSFSYSFFINSNNRPNYHLNSYSVSVAWSQMIYRNILDYQIIPHVDFQSDHFKALPGVILNLNLTF